MPTRFDWWRQVFKLPSRQRRLLAKMRERVALTTGHLEKPVIPAQAGIQCLDFTGGSPPARGLRKEGFSRCPKVDRRCGGVFEMG